jgi:hypothetical protein
MLKSPIFFKIQYLFYRFTRYFCLPTAKKKFIIHHLAQFHRFNGVNCS